jgi:hypothetical protein
MPALLHNPPPALLGRRGGGPMAMPDVREAAVLLGGRRAGAPWARGALTAAWTDALGSPGAVVSLRF